MKLEYIIENLEEIGLIHFFELWKEVDDIIMIKYDGFRENNQYTIVLIATESRFNTIRVDCDDLLDGLKNALSKYKSELNALKK